MRLAPRDRAAAFCDRYRLEVLILLAPMAGACPPDLSVAVANAGGMGAMGALAGQSAAMATDAPAADVVARIWNEARELLSDY